MRIETIGQALGTAPHALDYQHLRRLARGYKPLPVGPVEGMAKILGRVEDAHRRGRRAALNDARVASIYALEFLALVGLHLPVGIDGRKFCHVLDDLEQFAVGTCPRGAL